MEITRSTFKDNLSRVETAIEECDFLAIDTELSGLHRPETANRFNSLEDLYQEYREATQRFLVIQFGLCTFTWEAESGRYIAKPFNFYVFPTSKLGKLQVPNRVFMFQASAFDFLTSQAFDFNKWVYQGIPYLNKPDEEKLAANMERKLNNDFEKVPISEKDQVFVDDVNQKIKTWLAGDSADKDGVNITTQNGFQRRLVYQQVRESYPELHPDGRYNFIRITRLSNKKRDQQNDKMRKDYERDRSAAVGFRKVIELISASGKPIVGHNMFLDICNVIAHFIEPLPPTLAEFKALTHRIFPTVIDTKYLCSQVPDTTDVFANGTDLESVRSTTTQEAFNNPRIDVHEAFPRYLTEKLHEAGYDALVTGSVFLKIMSYIEEKLGLPVHNDDAEKRESPVVPCHEKTYDTEGWEISDDGNASDEWDFENVHNYGSTRIQLVDDQQHLTPVIDSCKNKIPIVRTAYSFLDLAGREVIPLDRPHAFHMCAKDEPITTQLDRISGTLADFGKYIVEPVDTHSAILVYENRPEADDVLRLLNDLPNIDFQPIQALHERLSSST